MTSEDIFLCIMGIGYIVLGVMFWKSEQGNRMSNEIHILKDRIKELEDENKGFKAEVQEMTNLFNVLDSANILTKKIDAKYSKDTQL